MANRNRNLVLAYFPSKEAAEAAGAGMKQWDHDRPDIKLGGMGIVTWDDGKLKTHKVGVRATGTGAKWGIILGAAAGILSGGITLIGGALAGLAAGAVGGTLFHKKLGMTDDDKLRLEMHLQDGGAALAVMVDDDELKPTRAELYNQGGAVEHYLVPETTLDELEDTAAMADVEDGHAVSVETVSGAPALAAAVRGLNEADAEKLVDSGLGTVDDLLQRAATPQGRAALAAEIGVSEVTILKWANDLDLSRVQGIGVNYANLLEQAGVDTVPDLARRNPANLYQKLVDVNEDLELVQVIPSEAQIAGWVAQAKELPRVITY